MSDLGNFWNPNKPFEKTVILQVNTIELLILGLIIEFQLVTRLIM